MSVYYVTVRGKQYTVEIPDVYTRPVRAIVDGEVVEVVVASAPAPTSASASTSALVAAPVPAPAPTAPQPPRRIVRFLLPLRRSKRRFRAPSSALA